MPALAETLSAEVAVPPDAGVTEVGVIVHVNPVGQLTVSPTALENPFSDVTVTVEPPLAPPGVTATVTGLALIEKSGLATVPHPFTLNVPIIVLQLNDPLCFRYSFVYQNVQSSTGSMLIAL